ncbi:apolipoprotein N-acyltransferase [Parvibaculum sp.]|uniref:apolipoprotein N-acyltransferase n=1 Tax=Parvibaculum sp. TaxID=2024848 RepID=UPI001B1E7D02|nr:apolipoprotein N-acyltransferase [Parvibaculum sp.]MBO6633966.1 apolipoprotein N-acyltransferase [Parvibaculum sp.]MBO6677554.1 apolipoprotein N-acyltransferase [Parvibaculum sp.]MBO6685347.1 apolipoprotein N-acyltransferase [Parvibaculum sp.]MBO6905215.1 apolipoprotein N-acyltransferase [Parvibaculum sp.]
MRFENGLLEAVDRLERFACFLSELRGWRRYLAAFVAGVVSVLALPPYEFLPVLFVSIPVLVWLLDGVGEPTRSRRRRVLWRAGLIGWWFGFGYFLFGLYWVGNAFLVDAEKFAFLLPVAVTLMPAGLALFTGAAAAIARLFWLNGYRRVAVLAVVWTIFEWLRGHILTGFPWNLIGESFTGSDALLQVAALVGAYGLSFIVMLIAGSPASFDTRLLPGSRRLDGELFAAPAIALAGLALIWVGGAARLSSAELDYSGATNVRIVHPDTPFAKDWDSEERLLTIIGQLLRMSREPTPESPAGLKPGTIVVWPENAVPVLLAREPYVLGAIGRMLPDGAYLIAGSNRGEPAPDGPSNRLRVFYNSLYVVDADGEIVETYDKHHLVPFGEYVPLRHLLGRIGLRQIVQFQGSFDVGPGPRTLVLPGMPPVSPLICYEIIFPEEIVAPGQRPAWLVNITNDAWFGESAGPYQHFSQVRMRAVEQGLPVARSANSGISALVDPYGRVVKSLPLDGRGIIDAKLPAPLQPTLYARLGDLFLAFLMLAAVAAAWYGHRSQEAAG